jgi:hypothetical protein
MTSSIKQRAQCFHSLTSDPSHVGRRVARSSTQTELQSIRTNLQTPKSSLATICNLNLMVPHSQIQGSEDCGIQESIKDIFRSQERVVICRRFTVQRSIINTRPFECPITIFILLWWHRYWCSRNVRVSDVKGLKKPTALRSSICS